MCVGGTGDLRLQALKNCPKEPLLARPEGFFRFRRTLSTMTPGRAVQKTV